MDVRRLLVTELVAVDQSTSRELALLRTFKSKTAKQKRLLQLFQCDLLPGINGKILELKQRRDSEKESEGVSMWAKIVGYIVVGGANMLMLFYIFLFALQQTKFRQDAWFRSFMTWLGLDIILVGSSMVFVFHIVIPYFAMKDLTRIKEKLLSSIREYEDKLIQHGDLKDTTDDEKSDKSFNSTEYFFVSTRIARTEEYKNLYIAKIINNFRTPWPRQSYKHATDYSQPYNSRFAALFSGIGKVFVFLAGGFIQFPTSVQDAVALTAFSTGMGYVIVLLAELYHLYPALIAIPIVTVAVVAHFIIKAVSARRHNVPAGTHVKVMPIVNEIRKIPSVDRPEMGQAVAEEDNDARSSDISSCDLEISSLESSSIDSDWIADQISSLDVDSKSPEEQDSVSNEFISEYTSSIDFSISIDISEDEGISHN